MATTVAAYQIDLRAQTRRLSRDLRRATQLWKRHSRAVGRDLAAMRQATLRLSAAIGGTVAASAVVATRTLREYEAVLHQITAITGVSRGEMSAYATALDEIGLAAGRGPVEMATALLRVTSAGFEGAEALDIVRQSAQASAAQLGDTSDIVSAATSAMSAFRDQGLTAAQAVNTLVEAARLGTADAADYAQALAQAQPLAASLGVTYQELAGSVAVLTRSLSGNASVAGTQVRAILQGFIKPSQTAVNLVEDLGISFESLGEKISNAGLHQTLVDLDTELRRGGSSLADYFTSAEALAGALGLVRGGGDEARSVISAMTDDLLVTRQAWEDVQGSTLLTSDQLGAALQQIRLAFSQGLSGELVRNLDITAQAAGGLRDAARGVGVAIGRVIASMRRAAAVAWDYRGVIALLGTSLIAVRVAIIGKRVLLAVLTLAKAMRALALATLFALKSLFALVARNPLIIIATAITAVVTTLSVSTGDIGRYLASWYDLFKAAALGVVANFGVIRPAFRALFAGIGLTIRAALQRNVLDPLNASIKAVFATVNTALGLLGQSGLDFGGRIEITLDSTAAVEHARRAYAEYEAAREEAEKSKTAFAQQLGEVAGLTLTAVQNVGEGIGAATSFAKDAIKSVTEFVTDPKAGVDALIADILATAEELAGARSQIGEAAGAGGAFVPPPLPSFDIPEPSGDQQGIDRFGVSLTERLSDAASRAISQGDFKGVGDALVTSLQDALSRVISTSLQSIFGGFLQSFLGRLFPGIGGGGFFQHGGIVPGTGNEARVIVAHAGEVVLNRRQQQALLNGRAGGQNQFVFAPQLVGLPDEAVDRVFQNQLPAWALQVEENLRSRGAIA